MFSKNTTAYIFLLFATLFWSGNFIVGKSASIFEIPPFSLNFYRWLFAFIILFPFIPIFNLGCGKTWGLAYYDDLKHRIPFMEIHHFKKTLEVICNQISSNIIWNICGSHRRRNSTSGDIDILLSLVNQNL